ncbi:MAG: MopE-related protein, partial [Myxococcota bacterium]|nr:MopE-related protein [Myxococcota bacterium]
RRTGVTQCTEDGNGTECSVAPGAPADDELCNGIDDNCDGTVDEGFEAVNDVCTVGIGACRRTGVTQCTEDGNGTECSVAPGAPADDELCNGIDDNCDGQVDEDFADLNQPCSVGVGSCQQTGITQCSADGAGTECSVAAAPPADGELCTGIDDDCDGKVDEDFADLNQPCSVGVGACQRTGVTQCTGDGVGTECSVAPGAPANAELCNGIDDNCDGVVDEGFDDRNQPCLVGIGACQRTGVTQCTGDGIGTECSVAPGAPADAELCNGIDDNCDGQVDEDFPSVGQVCEVGLGTCRRSGVFVCNGDGDATDCNADVVQGGQESCDYQDDDCDGVTDEAFVDADGRYTTLDHCGGCGNACAQLWDPSPEANGVQPTCEPAAATAVCGFTCLDGYRDADGLATNGCEFQDDPTAVYVSTPANGGVDDNDCGTSLRPCSTITQGIGIAFNDMGKTKVLVSDGLYRETVTLQPGIDVLGGHNRVNWTRNPEINTTIIRANDTQMIHAAAVYAINITQSTTLDGFAIEGETPVLGNSYGVYVRDSNQNLRITNNRIRAGNGARGSAGQSGSSGQPGVQGSRGSDAFPLNGACTLGDPSIAGNHGNVGGAGGSRSCGDVSPDGGRGGYTSCPAFERSEGSGVDGLLPANGGQGGLGGAGREGNDSNIGFICNIPDTSDNGRAQGEGETGLPGADGADGLGGSGAVSARGQLDADGHHWLGASGANGAPGVAGGGGGGGGAAAGIKINYRVDTFDIGASGGGGGSGGCPGDRGVGGTAGGGSFGVFIIFTNVGPANVDAFPVMQDNEVTRGFGGNGGPGGNGGAGGEGGKAGFGGQRGNGNLEMGFCVLSAGDGGPGGRGGHAGGGGGGQGGISYDVFVGNDNGLTPDYAADNVFPIPADEATEGLGGAGGNSSNTVVGVGSDGVTGDSGQLVSLD